MRRVEAKFRRLAALAWIALGVVHAIPARADTATFDVETLSDLYHITADRTLLHTREKVKEAFGHVVVSAEGKRLACDYLWFDDTTKDIKARGNVVFVDKKTTIEAAELHINLDTGFGSIFYGRVYNDLYSLRGQLIRKVGDDHYLTTEGEYSTCKDCPESWKLAARHVDLTMDGYAFMDGVFVKVSDVPSLYFPYLVIPVKTRRQTGLLFPRIGATSAHGFVYVQPLFLAIDKHQDMTIGAGTYSLRGPRYEAQYRYKSYHGMGGQTDLFYSRDKSYQPIAGQAYPNRGAIRSENDWSFFDHFGMRWRFLDVKDRDYIHDIPEDLNFSESRPAMESNVVVQAPFDDFFASLELKRYRNLLYDDPVNFDGGMVQALPTAHFGLKERRIAGPVLGNLYGRFDNFTRHNGPFYDADNNGIFNTNFKDPNNQDRIREARRTIVTPELSAPFSVGHYFSVSPAVQYTNMAYDFPFAPPNLVGRSKTSVSYVRTYVNVSTVFERVYDYDGDKIAKLKHQLVPFLSASYIPKVNEDANHPFRQQSLISSGAFDQFDVVPLTNSTNFDRFPQGKSLYYGFNSRLVRKKKRPEEIPRPYPYDLLPPSKPKTYAVPYNRKEENAIQAEKLWDQFNPRYDLYEEVWTFSASQAYDFLSRDAHPEDPSRAFSYALVKSDVIFTDQFTQHLEYRYYPSLVWIPPDNSPAVTYHAKKQFTTDLTWYLQKLQNLRHTRTLERSVGLSWTLNDQPNASRSIGGTVNWSFTDFVTVLGSYGWDLNAQAQQNFNLSTILTHPSECWGLGLHWDWNRNRTPNPGEIGFQLLLNFDGNGFSGNKSGGVFGG